MSLTRRSPVSKLRHDWRRFEPRAITRYARRLARGWFGSACEAARACCAELASHGLTRSTGQVLRRLRDRRDELNLARRNTWWIPAEDEVLERHARAVAEYRVRPLTAAAEACRRDLAALHRRLARANPGHPLADVERPASVVEAKLRARARALNPGWAAARWTAAEQRVAEKFARAVMAGKYVSSDRAARACRAELAARRVGPPRTMDGVTVFINILVRRFGLRRVCAWTPEQDRVVKRYARELVRGRFVSLFDAARPCLAELAQAAQARGGQEGDRAIHLHTLFSAASRIRDRAEEIGLPWNRSTYLPGEIRIIDRFARRVVAGRYKSIRVAVGPCMDELRRLHRDLARRSGLGSVPGRHREGVTSRLGKRCQELGRKSEPRIRWAGWEKRLLERWLHWYELWHDRRPKWALGDAVTGLQEALAARGSRRSREACKQAIVGLRRKLRSR